jgi:hypothetical protein
MKIAFHTLKIDVRGTCVSLYDYAHYHETLLFGKSIIITDSNASHDESVLQKFVRRFEVRYYDSVDNIDSKIEDCDIFYTIKYGKRDNILSKRIKNCIHCVFDLSEPHGDVYAAVSETLARKFNTTRYVPHMIGLRPSLTQDNLRSTLNIPSNAIVFGRHGGKDTFDLPLAIYAIVHAVNRHEHIHFVFVNTDKFYEHPRIHYIDKIVDCDEKNRFIMTCDAMIHAQSLGETFGIAIGEFSVNNKPIIAYSGPVWNDHYKHILGDKALWYNSEEECYKILSSFDPNIYKDQDLNCYKAYSPEKVMKIFHDVFIKST